MSEPREPLFILHDNDDITVTQFLSSTDAEETEGGTHVYGALLVKSGAFVDCYQLTVHSHMTIDPNAEASIFILEVYGNLLVKAGATLDVQDGKLLVHGIITVEEGGVLKH